MSRTKKILGMSALLVASVAANSFAYNALSEQDQAKMKVGHYLARLLNEGQSECKVEVTPFPVTKKDDSGNAVKDSSGNYIIDHSELLIRCYKGDWPNKWVYWGINLDQMCRPFITKERFGPIRLEDLITVETGSGAIITLPDIKTKVADTVTRAFSQYIVSNGNDCLDYQEFVQKYIGPGGPD